MSATSQVVACTQCGHQVYPARLRCPRCHGAQWAPVAVSQAVLQAWTTQRQDDGTTAHLGIVRVGEDGPHLVVRFDTPPQHAGQTVALQWRQIDGYLLPWGQCLA